MDHSRMSALSRQPEFSAGAAAPNWLSSRELHMEACPARSVLSAAVFLVSTLIEALRWNISAIRDVTPRAGALL